MDRIRAVGDLQQSGLHFLKSQVEVRSKFFESWNEGFLDPDLKVVVSQPLQSRSYLVHGAYTLGNVGRKFGYFHYLIVEVEDRIVGRLNPNFLPAFTDAFELGRDILSGVQFPPELLVIGRLRI